MTYAERSRSSRERPTAARACALAACAWLATGCAGVPDADDPVETYSAEAFYATTEYLVSAADGMISPDGAALMITSNATGVFNAYALDLDTGEQTPLSRSETGAVYGLGFFPDGRRFLFAGDTSGNERTHMNVGGDGPPVDLTPGDEVRASFVGWVDDRRAFLIATNERDPGSMDIYRYDAETYDRRLIFRNERGFQRFKARDDGTVAVAMLTHSSADNDVYLISLTGDAEPRLMTPHEGSVSHSAYEFTPDGRAFIYGTDEFGEHKQAWIYQLDSGDRSPLVVADTDIAYVDHSPSGRYRVVGVNEGETIAVSIFDRERNAAVALPEDLPDGDITRVVFGPDEQRVALVVNSEVSPPDIYIAELGARASRRLTHALNPAIDPEDLVESRSVRFESFDGLDIPALLFRPHGATPAQPAPAVVWIHGGPGGQSRKLYDARIQHLVNHGYAVLAVNNRGSSGYGKTFFHLDDRRHGQDDLQDIIYAERYLHTIDWVDGDRVAVMGGSYGGYLVMAALAFAPDVFDAGVDIFGVTNWVRTLESVPAWWEAERRALYDEMGDPATDGDRLRRISPLFHAENVTAPVLIVQGGNDPRVLQVESDEMVETLRANGADVTYVLFPDEGHGFRKRENRITASDAYVEFLDRHLAEDGDGG